MDKYSESLHDDFEIHSNQLDFLKKDQDSNSYPHADKSDGNFKIELDLGLALPFKYSCRDEDLSKSHSATVVKKVDSKGVIQTVKITTQSSEGPLQAVESDVLLVLLTMTASQYKMQQMTVRADEISVNATRVVFTLADICRMLDIDRGSSGRVAKAISRIKSQKILLSQISYDPSTNKLTDKMDETSIILRKGRVRVSNKQDMDQFKEFFYVDFDNLIVKNLYNDFFGTVEPKRYLSLGTGAQRRLYLFLQSKRASMGEIFTFNLDELIQILGLDGQQRIKRTITSLLEKVQGIIGIFDFTIQEKRKGIEFKGDCSNYTVLIKFKNDDLLVSNFDPFYQALIDWYGESELKMNDILEIDILSLRREIISKYSKANNDSDIFEYNKKKINVGEFVIDIVLHQVINSSYKVESFRGLCKSLGVKLAEGVLELPEKYRYFIYDRIETRKLRIDQERIQNLELQKKNKQEEEDRLFDISYRKMFEDFIMTSNQTRSKIENMAIEELSNEGIDHDTPLYESILSQTMFNIGKKLFISGDLADLRNKKLVIEIKEQEKKLIH